MSGQSPEIGQHGDRCDGCLMLAMVERAEVAESTLAATWAALDKAEALRPDDYKTGQEYLTPAFREVDYKAAFRALVEIVNEVERVSGYLVNRPGETPPS